MPRSDSATARLTAGSLLVAAGLAAASGCGGAASDARAERAPAGRVVRFTEVTEEAGLRIHRHRRPVLDPQLENIMPWMTSVGAAAAAGDFDRDGRLDLYVTSSRKGEPNHLYRNLGHGRFSDVARAAGLADVNDDGGVSMDCIWADLDNDGWSDLYLVRWGTDRVFSNQRDGTFREITAERFKRPDGTPGMPWANGNAVIALDFDLDGRLDLYVGNYFPPVNLWRLTSTRIMHDHFETARNAGPNFLFHQQRDGTFVERAAELGVDDTGWTLAAGSADLDNDGWPDLYCANDFGPDQLFLNRGDGTFRNVTDVSIGADTKKGMNVDFGDFNGDGWLDVYVTNITTARYLQEGNMLWRNNGPGADGIVRFMDVSPESGTFDGGWGWGGKFLDHDNDGDLDLFAVNGFISAGEGDYWYDLASWTVVDDDPADSRHWPTIGDRSFSGHEPFRFWHNEGDEHFRETAAEIGLASTRDGRGVVSFDYDDDGDLDLFVANQDAAAQLFRNDGGSEAGHWLVVRLEADPATGTNADGVHARVTAVTDGSRQIRERDGGVGYAGQSDPRLHFGLGDAEVVRLLEVRWPDGGMQYLEEVPADRLVTLRQDPGQYVGRPRLAITAPEPKARPVAPERPVPRMEPAELERLLVTMEQELRRNPADHALAHEYRRKCADHELHDRPIELFGALVERDGRASAPRLELAVALVDKIPSRGGLAAIVSKGTLARRSLDQLDVVVEREPDSWVAHYARGMNHLHWPRALRHSDAAVADFHRCLELQRGRDGAGGPAHYERTYVLLGDALAKAGSFGEARETWRRGAALYPSSDELRQRVALASDEAALAFVESRRSLETPIDTDLAAVMR